MWTFFQGRCAYCGTSLNRQKREGHLDHLISTSAGGSNHLSNRVLSCGSCNGDQKREKSWQEFMKLKNPDQTTHRKRQRRILHWTRTAGAPNLQAALLGLAEREAGSVIRAFDEACATVRSALHGKVPPSNKRVERTGGQTARHGRAPVATSRSRAKR